MKVLFVCTANSCRSQMAEAWSERLFPAGWIAASAGLITYPVTEGTLVAMREVGLDLSGRRSKSVDEFDLDAFDLVVTLSGEAGSYLPALARPERHLRRPVPDPMAARGSEAEVTAAFAAGRERIREIVAGLVSDADAGPAEAD